MTIQTPTQTGARILPLQKYAPGPLGAVGKLRYMPQQRGTAPVGRARAFLHDSFPEDLRLSVGGDSAKARARLERCMEVRENSRRIGSLLGSLSAPANDARALSRIAKELGLISELTREVSFFFLRMGESPVRLPEGHDASGAHRAVRGDFQSSASLRCRA